jgi:hypothetical protein
LRNEERILGECGVGPTATPPKEHPAA